VVLVALNLHQYWHLGWSKFALVSLIAIPVMALICGVLSRRQSCRIAEKQQATTS
jgi:hypothetical protein